MKEIDPYAFEEALKMAPSAKKLYAVTQDEKDRKAFDSKWEKLNGKLSTSNAGYSAPDVPFKPGSVIRDFNQLYHKIYDKEKYVNLWTSFEFLQRDSVLNNQNALSVFLK